MEAQNDKYWDLIVTTLNGESTPSQEEELNQWISASEENRRFYDKARRIILASQKGGTIPVFNADKAWECVVHNIQTDIRKKKLHRFIYYTSAAAAILIILISGLLFLPVKPQQEEAIVTADIQPGTKKATLVLDDGSSIAISTEPIAISQAGAEIKNDSITGLSLSNDNSQITNEEVKYSKLIIPAGGEYQITLSDGTKVWLNSASELRFPSRFTGNSREVELKGEAYFDVTHNSKKPFIVKTADMNIKVYGTEFNICAYDNDNKIAATLVNGKVSIKPVNGQEVMIYPSEQLSYSRNGQQISIQKVDISLYTSWKDGIYSFENATLEEIMNYIQRWYIFDITYDKENLRNMRFTGEFQKDKPLSYGLELIKLTCEVDFKIDHNKVLVTK